MALAIEQLFSVDDFLAQAEGFEATIYVWSAIGHTPKTGRAGSYCDELAKVTIRVADVGEARAKAIELVRSTPHGERGHFDVPAHPNQNIRSGWVGLR